ncbi:hypothetical protein [Ruegeria arenilitoris]|uniref:hypothetical protein n=1 Tax=Ruegeria arenilitoris TaxID=1173585 RepID=UPI00147C4387|nr:hypothetical protein [Ruegeria arenilitoris]
MSESLLSFSEVLLFGRTVDDLQIVKKGVESTVQLATTEKVDDFNDIEKEIDGEDVQDDDLILVRKNKASQNGVYKVSPAGGNKKKLEARMEIPKDGLVAVEKGVEFASSIWRQKKTPPKQSFKQANLRGEGRNNLLDSQLDLSAQFARIYGFAYEGTYYELPEPTVFLVHGDGEPAAAASGADARSPLDPSKSGVASADYQVSDGIRVWNYDKADYSIRMDVMTGMFEQVLLDLYFGDDSPAISGARVSGARVSGARVSGARVSGARVSGARVSGARARGSED